MSETMLQSDPLRIPPRPSLTQRSEVPPLVRRQRSFASVLGREFAAPGAQGKSRQDQARSTAEQLVAVAFIQPLLKQMRESSTAPPPFAPTQAERQFGSLMDASLAQEIVRAQQFPLVDRLARHLLGRKEMDDARSEIEKAAGAADARTTFPGVPNLAGSP
jgi:Rod binding domain-containing protein